MLMNAAVHREARGGVLVKIAKPGQERRVDLPSVGVETVAQAAGAGLAGIALETGGALVIGRDAVARAADDAGLFVIGVDALGTA
jgi:UDP-2,3-diacylglucosamine hydrolase